ncbi:hypothetical protein [Streptomyces aureoversilis]|uniref:Uncharacterized protein n=1 Tax=Streptomyces aureoversilis TaxID=67277 RepID=A0ABW0A8S0_9ACTN
MNDTSSTAAKADPAKLSLDFHHDHRLVDPSEQGVQTWTVHITADSETVGSLRATRGMYWQSENLSARMADEQDFPAVVSGQLLKPDGTFSDKFEDFVDMPGSVLVIDQLELPAPWDDPLIVAGVASSVIDRLTDNYFAVVFPRTAVTSCPGAALLEEAAAMLSADPFSDELLIIDNTLAAPEQAAHRVRENLRLRARYGGAEPWNEDVGDWEDDEDDDGILTPRTVAVLRLALNELSNEAWQEAAALGDEPLQRGAGGLFGKLPPVTFRQGSAWRREMARSFDDLLDDLNGKTEVEPRCTGEEMALHLGIARARALERNRPRLVREAAAGLPEQRRDFDWSACSDVLFQDHDVLMLFDAALDGIEDSSSDVNQALGMVNLAPLDWFTPFSPGLARDAARGFRDA